MGVHGLTTYLREHQRALSQFHEFSTNPSSSSPTPPAHLVVDGWSFIYELHCNSRLPWVYGGEHEEITKVMAKVVQSWISVGLKLFFVFDGAYPSIKYPTLLDRAVQSYIQPLLLFFRTSIAARERPRFLRETRIIPPLFYTICLCALQNIARSNNELEIHFADEEADPYAVELAGRVGGYVVSNDSDYVILNSDGYLGHVPINEMVWTAPLQDDESALHDDGDDDDFQLVTRPKEKKKRLPTHDVLRGLIPPSDITPGLSLSFLSYSPSRLASHLNLPVSLLPLLSSFVGNDFSKKLSPHRDLQRLFFNRQLTLSDRIDHVASTIRSTLSTSSQKRKQKQKVTSIMDLINNTANTLLASVIHTMGSGEVQLIVDSVVEATLQYVIPKSEAKDGLWPTEVCALHEPDLCPILPFFSRSLVAERVTQRNQVRQLYIKAYRRGDLSPALMNILSTGNYWPTLFLEHPDVQSVSLTIGSQLRLWGYAILDDALGLPDSEVEEEEEKASSEPNDASEDEELVDVTGEDSEEDWLAPLRGELKRLHDSEDVPTDPPPSVLPSRSRSSRQLGPKTVTEYIRRGTRVAASVVTVPSLSDLLSSIPDFDSNNAVPLPLRTEDARLAVLLRVTESDTSLVRALPRDQLIAALTVRWVAHAAHLQAQKSEGNKDKDIQRWTKREAHSLLASFSWSTATPSTSLQAATPSTQDTLPSIEDRNVQLMSQALMALGSIEHLSQILLITDRVGSIAHRLSGQRCHSFWTGVKPLNTDIIPHGLWDACLEGLDGAFGEEPRKKMKKGRNERMEAVTYPGTTAWKSTGGLFGFLKNVEI